MEKNEATAATREKGEGVIEKDPDSIPPYSRLFCVCGKTVSQEVLLEYFKPFGNVEYCRILKDKVNGESKGIAYVKYDKASSAALAIEALHGKQLSEDSAPLKVLIADAKGSTPTRSREQSKEPEDNPPRSRLFVICAKELTEDELGIHFQVYGDFEYCRMMMDKGTNESKGFAFVKFSKASSAAHAMESINEQGQIGGLKVKALIADPKSKRFIQSEHKSESPRGVSPLPDTNRPNSYPYPYPPPSVYGYSDPMAPYALFQPLPKQRLFIVCHKSVTQDQLARIFSRFPGMEYCDLKVNKSTGESKGFAYVNYSTPQAAYAAKDQLDGIEFPPHCILKVMYAEPLGVKPTSEQSSESPMIREGYPPVIPPPYPPPQSDSRTGSRSYSGRNEATNGTDRNFPEGSRLFLVLSKSLPEYVLQTIFGRIAGLEYTRLQKDKNYGYVKYATPAAAQIAIQQFNGIEYNGVRFKLQIANPPSDSRKRQRTET